MQRLAEGLFSTRSGSAYPAASAIARIAREYPELGTEAVQLLTRSFQYLPMESWYAVITIIQDLGVESNELSMAAYAAMETPLAIAERTLATGNSSMQQRAVEVAQQIASRMPALVDRVFNDLLPLLGNIDPYAPELAGSVQSALFVFANANPARAERLYQPLKSRLDALLERRAQAPAAGRSDDDRYSIDALIDGTVQTYASVAARSSEANATEALQMLDRVFVDVPGKTRRSAVRGMTAIGERHAPLARTVMESVLEHDAQLQHSAKVGSECMKRLAAAHSDLAADVAHYFRDQLKSSGNEAQARGDLRTLIAQQPAATAYVIADMKKLLGTDWSPEAITVLCDVAWSAGDQRAAILTELASAQGRGTRGFDNTSVWTSLVSLARSRPPQRPVVRGMLQAYLQQLTSGDPVRDASKIAQVAQWLEQLNASQSAVHD